MRGMWALRGLGLLAALLVIPVVRADVKVSPDGRNKIVYERGEITVSRDGKVLLGPQAVSLTVDRGQPEIELCARNDGVAYRFRTNVDGEVTVSNEIASLVFPSEKTRLWVGYNWCDNPGDPKQDKLQHGCASIYTRTTVGEFVPDKRRIAYLPLLAQYADGTAVWVS
ncbi:MAG: glycoside hydrolase family 97 N-terminal domain-containing protein, partial [Kiritimatiellae bacterium]|nr:glycoside hydrolase family 97 N-terminal domain-containing protein [Kiritimatiellia bacterium]